MRVEAANGTTVSYVYGYALYSPLDQNRRTYMRVINRLSRVGHGHIYASLPEPLRTRNFKRPPPRLRRKTWSRVDVRYMTIDQCPNNVPLGSFSNTIDLSFANLEDLLKDDRITVTRT